MRSSHQLFLLLIFLLTGVPILTRKPSDATKNVRMVISDIVSYTHRSGLSGPPKLCIFSSSRLSITLQENVATSLSYLLVVIHTQQEAIASSCDGFYLGNESPTFRVGLIEQHPSETLLLTTEQNTEYIIGNAFYLIIRDNDVRPTVNLSALLRSGVRVNPDILMLAWKESDK